MIDMKKIALMLAVALGSAACFAQINKSELKQLQNFLNQPAETESTNAQALKITNVKDPSTCTLNCLSHTALELERSTGDATGICSPVSARE